MINHFGFLTVSDLDGQAVLIAIDNISHLVSADDTTRIYLRHVAGTPGLWYILTRESVPSITQRLWEAWEALGQR